MHFSVESVEFITRTETTKETTRYFSQNLVLQIGMMISPRHLLAYGKINQLIYSDLDNFGDLFFPEARAARSKKNDIDKLNLVGRM